MPVDYKPKIAYQGCLMISPDGQPHSPLEHGVDNSHCLLLLHPDEMNEAGVRQAVQHARHTMASTAGMKWNYCERLVERLRAQMSGIPKLMVYEELQERGELPDGMPALRDIREREGFLKACQKIADWETTPGNVKDGNMSVVFDSYSRTRKLVRDRIGKVMRDHIYKTLGLEDSGKMEGSPLLVESIADPRSRRAKEFIQPLLMRRLDELEADPGHLLAASSDRVRELHARDPAYTHDVRAELREKLESSLEQLPRRMQVMLMHYNPVHFIADSEVNVKRGESFLGSYYAGMNMIYLKRGEGLRYPTVFEESCHLINHHVMPLERFPEFAQAYRSDLKDARARLTFDAFASKGLLEEYSYYKNSPDYVFGGEVLAELCWIEEELAKYKGIDTQEARGIIVERFPKMGKLYLEYCAAEEKEYQRITFRDSPEAHETSSGETAGHRARLQEQPAGKGRGSEGR